MSASVHTRTRQPKSRPARLAALTVFAGALAVACSAGLPARYVIERDLAGFDYRRYQKTLDVDLAVAGNEAVGHSATYVRRDAGRTVAFATAFVTRYARARSLCAEVRERLVELSTYQHAVVEQGGGHVFTLDAGPEERWVLWVSGPHVVKVGAPPGEAVPEALVEAYMDLYPSELDAHGNAEPEAACAGPSQSAQREHEDDERDLPRHLREGTPR